MKLKNLLENNAFKLVVAFMNSKFQIRMYLITKWLWNAVVVAMDLLSLPFLNACFWFKVSEINLTWIPLCINRVVCSYKNKNEKRNWQLFLDILSYIDDQIVLKWFIKPLIIKFIKLTKQIQKKKVTWKISHPGLGMMSITNHYGIKSFLPS